MKVAAAAAAAAAAAVAAVAAAALAAGQDGGQPLQVLPHRGDLVDVDVQDLLESAGGLRVQHEAEVGKPGRVGGVARLNLL